MAAVSLCRFWRRFISKFCEPYSDVKIDTSTSETKVGREAKHLSVSSNGFRDSIVGDDFFVCDES